MSLFDIERTLKQARKRLGDDRKRIRRSDHGKLRMDTAVQDELRRLLAVQERPKISVVRRRLTRFCQQRGLRCPSRATVYNALGRLKPQQCAVKGLPKAARLALYNLPDAEQVPGPQLVFYCFNYGSLEATTFAAGLPWLNLYQALQTPGWQPKSLALLRAVARARRVI